MPPTNIFKIHTSAIEARSDTERHILRGVATGTALDAEGDRMSVKALRAIESRIIGLTLHKDHVFKVDNTLGHFTSAKIITDPRGDIRELWVEAELEPFDVNPDARRVYEKIQSGTRLGFSVAGLLRGWEKLESKNGKERFLITDIELLSVDLVTIPAYRASQGSITATGHPSSLHDTDTSPDNFISKEIGSIIRSEPIPDISNQSDTSTEISELSASASPDPSSPLDILRSRIDELESKLSNLEIILQKTLSHPTPQPVDYSELVKRVERIESNIVEPPKSRGIMLNRDGHPESSSDDLEAFEKGAVKLL